MVYLIAIIEVTNDEWIPDYAGNVHDIVHKHGGKYLSRSGNITTVEGGATAANLIALLQFPSMEAVEAFASDPEYAPYGEAPVRICAPGSRAHRTIGSYLVFRSVRARSAQSSLARTTRSDCLEGWVRLGRLRHARGSR